LSKAERCEEAYGQAQSEAKHQSSQNSLPLPVDGSISRALPSTPQATQKWKSTILKNCQNCCSEFVIASRNKMADQSGSS